MHPKDLSILDFNYDLPARKIASYPLEQRDASKLLVYGAGVHDVGAHNFGTGAAQISETTYSKLDEVLPSNTLLIHNDTKVVAARLFFEKENGSLICNKLLNTDISTAEGMEDAVENQSFNTVCPKLIESASNILSTMFKKYPVK